ncbi:MAG: 50S ribosomal protein L16 [Candidatus Thermoplasmatota archaeon]
MVRKPGSMYRQIKGPAYTRREYMGGVPHNRITQFDLGNMRQDFPVAMSLVVLEPCQIRHMALEAARVVANRYIQKRAGNLGYHLKVRAFPHHVLRENKMATGAGADRVSSGMRASFGKAVGTAVRAHSGQKVMTIRTTAPHFKEAKIALWKAGQKLPAPVRIIVEKGAEEI